MTKVLEALRHHEAFLASPVPTCAIDEDFVIRAVNPAYTLATGTEEDALLSFDLFELFPGNPEEPESDGHVHVRRSAERVLREGRLHHLLIQRYDIPDRADEGRFVTRYWEPVNRPFLVEDSVRGVVISAQPVDPPTEKTLAAIAAVRQATGGGFFLDEPAEQSRLEALSEAIREISELGREVSQLREALESRGTIEQAKGLLMASHGGTPEEAFKRLVRLSNNSNVRVAEVARALVYRAQTIDD
ncbi:ANTAR domain-containing protein [Nocardioides campestrisoli]|uniref:ANTAR domain-containing protein n=1 Tax=Nocardioides campestrisoli TaxID=2736757 RepID=UPI0015E77F20|nr:ANTAR domain-containing protein [Nocardioides campestrisoli]